MTTIKTNLVNDKSEMLKFDTSSCGDVFGWMEETRGLDLQLIDNENMLDQANDDLEKLVPLRTMRYVVENLKSKGAAQRVAMNRRASLEKRYPHLAGGLDDCLEYEVTEFNYIVSQYKKAAAELSRLEAIAEMVREDHDDLDSKIFSAQMDAQRAEEVLESARDHQYIEVDLLDMPCEEGTDVPDKEYNKVHWHEVCRQGEEMEYLLKAMAKAGTLNKENAPFVLDRLSELMAKRTITTYNYARCSYMVAKWLGWEDDMDMFARMGEKYKPTRKVEPVNFSATYDDRFYGEMSISSPEDAIDMMDRVRAYASDNDLALEDAYYGYMCALEEDELSN